MSDVAAVTVAFAVPLGLALNAWMGFWIRRLEKNTNSMKDQLVALTAQAEHAKGVLQGKAEAGQ